MFSMKRTVGVQDLAETKGAFWLLDLIASYQDDPRVKDDEQLQEVQFWKLEVREDESATVTCERDSDDVAITQIVPYTDFPGTGCRIWVENGTMILPEEH